MKTNEMTGYAKSHLGMKNQMLHMGEKKKLYQEIKGLI